MLVAGPEGPGHQFIAGLVVRSAECVEQRGHACSSRHTGCLACLRGRAPFVVFMHLRAGVQYGGVPGGYRVLPAVGVCSEQLGRG